MNNFDLVKKARKAKTKAFAPYSNYSVGAAIHTDKGVFQGANIEVSGRSTSVHAEMMAVFTAIMNESTEFYTIAISAGENPSGDVAPCGLCQHTLAQFTEELLILEDAGEGEYKEYHLNDLIGPAYRPSTRER